MGVGAVLEMTGRSKLSELGGLYAKMPLALIFTVIGGISISGFPLTSGFISKSMIIAAAGENHQVGIMIMLLLASVGTFLSVGIKLPYFIWFGGKKDSDIEAKDAPWNMNLGMAMAAFFCIALGFPGQFFGYHWLYDMLPTAVTWDPYSTYHLSETFQILGFTGFGFFLLVTFLKPKPYIALDLDWFYRKGARVFMWVASKPIHAANEFVDNVWKNVGLAFTMAVARFASWFDKEGIDWVIDGSARSVVEGGNQLRQIETGKIQQYIGAAVLILFVILIAVVLNV
jgi:multicomponent Na+:H+ antiporter subunit D